MPSIRVLTVFSILFCFAVGAFPASAGQVIEAGPVEYKFGDEINFYASFQSDVPVELAIIFFQAKNDTQTFVELASVKQLKVHEFDIQHTHPISKHRFQAFSTIEYRFEIMLEGGEFYKSPSFEFQYIDNRFEWASLQEGPFIVYWFDGDYTFAQGILDVAQEGLQKITSLLPLSEPELLHIYIYPDSGLMREALNPAGEDWIAGHAYPDLQTMVLYLPPGPDHILDVRQRVPHELMHILLSQYSGSGYASLPFWLAEGLASMVELYPNPDYAILLENAAAKDTLIPINTLCESFPRDASGALLAYAESAAFTKFLYDSFGSNGLQRLISEYSGGKDCENGSQSALGIGLEQLEHRWSRESLSGNPTSGAIMRMLPWLAILTLLFLAPVVYVIRSLKPKKSADYQEARNKEMTAVESREGR